MDTVLRENKSLRCFFAVALVLLMVLSNLSPFVGTAAAAETEAQSDLTLLDRASTWKYLDNGSDQGTDWKEKDFNDGEWNSGVAPLGYPASEKHGTFGNIATIIEYGESSQSKHATSYFRTTFEVEDLSKISTSGLITAGIDDSAIIYLNGKEIVRFNLPEGKEIKFDDYVEDFGLDDASESSDKTFNLTQEQMSYIVEGTNVLAAEVHQDRPSSSDLFFDMDFTSIYQAPVDPTVYDASYISFAPGADETKRNFSWYSPKTDVPGVIEYGIKGKPETTKTIPATLVEASSGYQAN
ncbi:MAG: hypothetical protein WAM95_00265, partial [Bacillus sp. (in: firmicutes)]